MEIRLPEQKLNEHLLREAAQSGNIDALYNVIAQDPLILKRIDEAPFIDTPLHTAALRNQADFALEILNLMPSYARKLNQDGASPLHLAVESHNRKNVDFESNNVSVVDCIIRNDKDSIRVKGRQGMTPLFHAILKNDSELVVKFLVECPKCIKDENNLSESSPCFALKNEKNENFDIFKILVGWLRRSTHKDARAWEDQVLNAKDRDGNTLMHIAAAKGLDWAVNSLLNSKLVDITTKNNKEFTAQDVAKSDHHTWITLILWWSSFVRGLIIRPPRPEQLQKRLQSNISLWDLSNIHIQRERQSISMETRDALLVVFVLVATANYQAALSPPGGLWQGNADTNSRPNLFNDYQLVQHSQTSFSPSEAPVGGEVGTIVADRSSFEVIWWLNSVTLMISFVLILFLFPKGARKLLLVPLCLMSVIYALSMSIITQDKHWYIKNMYWFFPLIGLIYFLTWLGPLKEFKERKYRREWGTDDIQ